jgi:hypothetical protein
MSVSKEQLVITSENHSSYLRSGTVLITEVIIGPNVLVFISCGPPSVTEVRVQYIIEVTFNWYGNPTLWRIQQVKTMQLIIIICFPISNVHKFRRLYGQSDNSLTLFNTSAWKIATEIQIDQCKLMVKPLVSFVWTTRSAGCWFFTNIYQLPVLFDLKFLYHQFQHQFLDIPNILK